MKKTLLVAALTGVFATAAHAQSSVTLYGLLDAGMSYTNNVATNPNGAHGSAIRFTSGLMEDNRWGLKGAEDLGGGLKAVFNLESGFTIGNGRSAQGSRQFGRSAYVGLSSDTAGTVTLGRQSEFMFDYVGQLSFTNFNGNGGYVFAHPLDNDNAAGTFRVNNAVKYSSVNYNGLTFGGMYGMSNEAGGFGDNRAYSLGVNYNNGPIKAALAYTQLNNDRNNINPFTGTSANTNGAVSNDSNFTAQRQRTFGGGANYTFGPANVGFVVTDTQMTNVSSFSGAPVNLVGGMSSVRYTNYEVNAHYSLTPALSLGAAYTYTDSKATIAGTSVSPKYNQFSLLSDYSLSKRTDVYALATYQRVNGGKGLFTANINSGGGFSSSNNQVLLGFGLRTRF